MNIFLSSSEDHITNHLQQITVSKFVDLENERDSEWGIRFEITYNSVSVYVLARREDDEAQGKFQTFPFQKYLETTNEGNIVIVTISPLFATAGEISF